MNGSDQKKEREYLKGWDEFLFPFPDQRMNCWIREMGKVGKKNMENLTTSLPAHLAALMHRTQNVCDGSFFLNINIRLKRRVGHNETKTDVVLTSMSDKIIRTSLQHFDGTKLIKSTLCGSTTLVLGYYQVP